MEAEKCSFFNIYDDLLKRYTAYSPESRKKSIHGRLSDMKPTVLKFGGSSIPDAEAIHQIARRLADQYRNQDKPHMVVIVSAMGKTTDRLLCLAQQISTKPDPRELDTLLSTGEQVSISLLTMALHNEGIPAVSFTASQINLITTAKHTAAEIRSIDPKPIQRELERGRIVIIAGFQGMTENGTITTLGRGGSDTTAVAIAAALDADLCEINTDVPGVCTADPQLIPTAQTIEHITYEHMLELAALGVAVIHPDAVRIGFDKQLPIHIRHHSQPSPGTIITDEPRGDDRNRVIVGCAVTDRLDRITLTGVPNIPGSAASLFRAIAEVGVTVDDIIQTISDSSEPAPQRPHQPAVWWPKRNEQPDDSAVISLTVDPGDTEIVEQALYSAIDGMWQQTLEDDEHALSKPIQMSIDSELSKISIVGDMKHHRSQVAADMFESLNQIGVNVANITTSELRISCLVKRDQAHRSLEAVHQTLIAEPYLL